ncbi:hypothetical protein DH2020_042627 [Rehmannia glutinosa]|uniref:DUF7806 domain-containing protein n=1 Tax=Rehmannia glutinosa TaxID=99300 RepID=A0ABR0UMI8_REHGL
MEALYAKLYNKYTKLKKEKETQFDKLNHDQEVKFLNFAAAADEMIQYLKSENDRLNGQVDELKSELASIRHEYKRIMQSTRLSSRLFPFLYLLFSFFCSTLFGCRSSSDEQHIHYQKLLMEENQKNKELSEEIARLQKLEHNQCSNCTLHEEVGRGQENSHDDTPAEETSAKSVKNLMKTVNLCIQLLLSIWNLTVYQINMFMGTKAVVLQASSRKIYSSGGDATGTSSVNCVFQYLVEFVVGMKVSPLTQSNELCVLVHHQSSGYSFSLTWIPNSRGEVELLYRVLSLGTFERVAPDWMKETLMFSTSMCSVFFERVSRVIKS